MRLYYFSLGFTSKLGRKYKKFPSTFSLTLCNLPLATSANQGYHQWTSSDIIIIQISQHCEARNYSSTVERWLDICLQSAIDRKLEIWLSFNLGSYSSLDTAFCSLSSQNNVPFLYCQSRWYVLIKSVFQT